MKFQRVTEALASPPCEIIQKSNRKEKGGNSYFCSGTMVTGKQSKQN